MKYAILIGDGMADRPLEELGQKTPLEAAKTPNMDEVVKEGCIGLVKTVPAGMEPASDVANLALLGYDPSVYYCGRGPLEAANMGVELEEDMVAFRCNLITVSDNIMDDYSAGHISNKEAEAIIEFLNKNLSSDKVKFYPGISYRHLMVVRADDKKEFNALKEAQCVPPHNILGQKIAKYMPSVRGTNIINDLMNRSRELLKEHEINKVRIDLKENPVDMIWLWGQGVKPKMPKFVDRFGLTGSVISAVDLVKGIAKLAGLDPIKVPGATGYYDTDYAAKARYALDSLSKKDFVYVHVEAPDEAGHNGDLRAKITAIENFDKKIVGKIFKTLKKQKEDFRVLVLPDHATPISERTHTDESVPFALCGYGIEKDDFTEYNEKTAADTKLFFKSGAELVEFFLKS
jgi:2,3-bisphosphoglycerate-independent phosphoglycerate mutase